ncbi:MAG: ATP-binding protein [Lachnospiraceae bacterium]|nr:ATP-binding protein [Lachnospiraceae bacterium]MBP3609590.1 ATP-binding protein [Lachnospiraceae bacterium]
MINKFSCHNFRNINADNLEFEKINILIGPNNSGKSNFIKAITFFSEMLKNSGEGNLKSAFLNAVARNGWEHSLYKHADPDAPIDFTWEICLNGEPVRYKFSFGVGSTVEKCNIVLEELSSAEPKMGYDREFNYFRCHDHKIGLGNFSTAIKVGAKNRRLAFEVDSKETLIMQFKDILLKNQNIYGNELIRVNIAQLLYELQKYFEGFSVYTSAQFESGKLREPVNMKAVDDSLNKNASNFTNVFNRYKSEDVFWKINFEKKLKELIPNLQMADTVNAYDKLIFKMVYDEEQYDLSDVSEGTLKGLILNMLINMPMKNQRTLLAIDEPETNLHPAWQKVIGNWIQTADTFSQCFISTHSPDFLDVFTEEFKREKVAVFVFGNNDTIKKIQYRDIVDELGEWELGDLYRTNDPALGGWPW